MGLSEHPLGLFDLTGQVAIVTGAGRGIGRHLAISLAEAGASVVAASRTEAELASVVTDIRQAGGNAAACHVDVTQPSTVDELVNATLEQFEGIDILVNCAGRVLIASALELTPGDWRAMLETNVTGLFLCCQAAGKVMLEQRKGKIINISSALGLVGLEHRVAYCASKGGVILLTRALAAEWAPYNVTVNAIAPTTTLTGETAALYADPERLAEKTKDIPLGRLGHPQDVAGAALYLASSAADFVTGHTLVVDGGYTAV
jgi:NAD(P)-dependent dehydrogenase (short-subunit alcohol dehydrogenase family)